MKILFPFLLLVFSLQCTKGQNTDSLSLFVEQYIDEINPSLPFIDFVLEQNITDVSVCKGPNRTYYLTGTTGDKQGVHEGIKVWASYDMKNWNLVTDNGYVWTFSNDGKKWQREISNHKGWKARGIISPKIYYYNNTFWIAYSNSNSNKAGILKSKTGKANGPYEDVTGDVPLLDAESISLLFDTDSTLYVMTNFGAVFQMNRTYNALTSLQPRYISDINGKRFLNYCNQLVRIGDIYYLSKSKWNTHQNKTLQASRNSESMPDAVDASFDGVIAFSRSLFGNYTISNNILPHAGGGQLFDDFDGNWWFAFSGDDISSPVSGNPAFLPMSIKEPGQIEIKSKPIYNNSDKIQIVYVSQNGNNTTGNNWENAYSSLQRAVDNAQNGTQIWVAKGKYEAPVNIHMRDQIFIYGGFIGNETSLSQRNSSKNKVYINGRNSVRHVFYITSSTNIRIDGLSIQGGNASGENNHHQYGGGVHILGGGETVRIVNCTFENNKADQDGGGLYASVGAAPLVLNCKFSNNVSRNNGGAVAVYCNAPNGYNAKFYNCIFDNNFAYGDGGAIYFDTHKKKSGLLTIVNCLITNNTTLKEGGALALDRNSNLFMLNSTVCFNKGAALGASVANFGKVPAKSRVINSIFSQNYGGILFTIEGEAELIKSADNNFTPNVWVSFTNCIFDSNDVNALVQRNFDKRRWKTVAELNESVMGKNCLSVESGFIDPYKLDFKLNNGSRARNSGTKDYIFDFNIENQNRRGNVNIGCY